MSNHSRSHSAAEAFTTYEYENVPMLLEANQDQLVYPANWEQHQREIYIFRKKMQSCSKNRKTKFKKSLVCP